MKLGHIQEDIAWNDIDGLYVTMGWTWAKITHNLTPRMTRSFSIERTASRGPSAHEGRLAACTEITTFISLEPCLSSNF
jgi:hypothetical protein